MFGGPGGWQQRSFPARQPKTADGGTVPWRPRSPAFDSVKYREHLVSTSGQRLRRVLVPRWGWGFLEAPTPTGMDPLMIMGQ